MMPRFTRFLFSLAVTSALILGAGEARAQLITQGSNDATTLAQVLAGPGVIISNATLNCGQNGAGTFTCAPCSANVPDGVILTSGTHNIAVGPNNNGGAFAVTGNGGDADLASLSGFSTFDKCVLEFDVFVIADTLKFNFVFGSEEYLEYVGTQFNDVFGFFISGPGISGPYANNSRNIALVPGTFTPITINTVNNTTNSQYYVYNGTGGDAPYNSNPYYVQYDGLTTLLTAKSAVTPCQTYHLRLAIADAGDDVLDSGVFLEAKSVSSSGITLSANTSVSGFPFLIEGCVDGEVTFTRNTVTASDTTIWYTIGGTATNGVDYNLMADSITIPANQASASLSILPIVDGLPEGAESIILYIYEPCNGALVDSVFLILQDDIVPVVSNDTVICAGTATQLIATGGAQYSWDPPTGLNNSNIFNPVASPTATTTYTVTLSVATCTAQDSVTVTVQPLPVISGISDTGICIGDTLQVNATVPGATSFFWSPNMQVSDVTVLNPKIWNSIARTYTLIATDQYGCWSDTTMLVDVWPIPNIIAAANPLSVCVGSPSVLTGSGGVGYVWQPDSLTGSPVTVYPTSTTTYTVTGSNIFGCSKNASVTVTTKTAPIVNAGPDKFICEGGSVTLSGSASGNPPYTVSWSPTANLSNPYILNPIVTGLLDTTAFVLQVTNSNNCTTRDTVIVFVNPKPTITITPSAPALCIGSSVQLVASGASTYAWSPAFGLSATNIPDPVASPTSTVTYVVTGVDSNSCQNTASVPVTVHQLPTANAGQDQTICEGDSTQLSGSGGVSYLWSPPQDLNDSTLQNPTASPTDTTVYSLTVTDANGCMDDDIMVLNVAPAPVADAGPDVAICLNASTQLGASGGVSYSWDPPSGLSDPNIANPMSTPAGTTTYIVTVTDANGCEDTDDVTVTVNPLPTANAGPDVDICIGFSTQLNGSGGVSYSWNPLTSLSDPNIPDPVGTPSLTTTYTLTVTDANGCTDDDDVVVTVNLLPPANAGNDVSICIGDNTQLNASGGVQYDWSPTIALSDTTIPNPIAQPASTTTYTVTVTDNFGCVNDDSVVVTVNLLPVADAGADLSACEGVPVQMNASGGVGYSWTPVIGLSNPNIPNPTATPPTSMSYTVTVTDANGCVNDDDMFITIFPAPTAEAGLDQGMCPGGSVQLDGSGGITFSWSPTTDLSDPNIANPVAIPTVSTTYFLTVTDVNGCEGTDAVEVTVFPEVIAHAGQDQHILVGASTIMQGTGGAYYVWSPSTGLSDPNDPNAVAAPPVSTLYHLLVTSIQGCTGEDSVLIEVLHPTIVRMPTAFSPNGDGLNDVFHIHFMNDLQIARFMIYNRWGQVVFETTDPTEGWDGRYGGEPQPVGAYMYIVRGSGADNEPVVRQGSVTLLR